MTDSVDNLSIDEILTSIKKYMSDEKQPETSSVTDKSPGKEDDQNEQSTNNTSNPSPLPTNHSLSTNAESLASYETSSHKQSSQVTQTSQLSIDGAIRLNPIFEETLPPSEDTPFMDASLPSFIQHDRISPERPESSKSVSYGEDKNIQNRNTSPANTAGTIEVFAAQQPENKSNAATVDSFKSFIQGVGQIIHQTSPDSQKCGLDAFVQKEIKRAVDAWIKDNMASFVQVIVQKSVEKELKQITDTLLNPSLKNL